MQRALSFALLPVAALCAAAAACGDDSSKPTGSGDHVVVDVDATTQPPQDQADASYYADVFGPGDSAYAPPPDGYAPYTVCAKCGCGASTYCFGGGTGYTTQTAVCGADAALPADGGVQVGCNPIPPECASAGPKEICPCLLKAVGSITPCYAVCTDVPGLIVYCPTP